MALPEFDRDALIRRPVRRDSEPSPEVTPEIELARLKRRIAQAREMPVPAGIADDRTWKMGRDAAIARIVGPEG